MTAIANAALPVAVGLIMLAGVARAILEWSSDPDFVKLSREHLEPLTTWCLIATFLYVGAHAASGDIGVVTIVLAAIIGGAAVVVRDSAKEESREEEDEPVIDRGNAGSGTGDRADTLLRRPLGAPRVLGLPGGLARPRRLLQAGALERVDLRHQSAQTRPQPAPRPQIELGANRLAVAATGERSHAGDSTAGPKCLDRQSGTLARSSSSHTTADESLGARQSPRGDSEPPEPTFGAFGIAERLNCEVWKNRRRKTSSQRLIGSLLAASSGIRPATGRAASPHACNAMKATLDGR